MLSAHPFCCELCLLHLQTLLATWTNWLQSEDQSTHTIRAYLRGVRQFANWFEAENREPLTGANLTAIDMVAYRQYLQRQQRAASSTNQQLAVLRSFTLWSVEVGHRADNPAKRVRDLTISAKRKPKALEAKEINALLRAAQEDGTRAYAMIQMLVQTGIRLSECAALALGDIAMSERMGQIAIRFGKGNAVRQVPANASVRLALAEYLAPQWNVAPTVKAIVGVWADRPADTPLWTGQRGALTARSIARTVEELVLPLARRGLIAKQTSAHILRHTFATVYLQDNPGDIVGLASLLGHTTLETTRIYVESSEDELARRVEQGRLNAYE